MWQRTGVVEIRRYYKYEEVVCGCGKRASVRLMPDGGLRSKACNACSPKAAKHGRYTRLAGKCSVGDIDGCWLTDGTRIRIGALGHANRSHGCSKTPEYSSWSAMMHRTLNPHRSKFDGHGGRGIVPCQRLRDFVGFRNEMGPRPSGLTLERPDNSRGYDCGTCDECVGRGAARNVKWGTPVEQGNNTRRNVFIVIDGRSMTASQWARETGINDKTIYQRWRAGDRSAARLLRPSEKPYMGQPRANAPHLAASREVVT